MSTTLLEIRDVRLSFGGVRALDGVDLIVDDGHDFWGLIGPNGSGKTTLFNAVTGLYRPDSGTIAGTAVQKMHGGMPKLGRTFQHPRVFGQLSVTENLLSASQGLSRSAANSRAGQLLELLDLAPVRRRRACQLSIGQQKLVELARALMRDPELMLLDEVAAGIHPRLRTQIAGYLRRLAGLGTRFLIIEHDMQFLMGLCTHVVCLANGRPIAAGTPEEVRADRRVREEYLGSDDE
jgi:ABC-type branched-subunit amino acid transport system ATPase component